MIDRTRKTSAPERPPRIRAARAKTWVRARVVCLVTALTAAAAPVAAQDPPVKIFISVDMEGIGGIGTGAMTSSGGTLRIDPTRSLLILPPVKACGFARYKTMDICQVVIPLGFSFCAIAVRISPRRTGPYLSS